MLSDNVLRPSHRPLNPRCPSQSSSLSGRSGNPISSLFGFGSLASLLYLLCKEADFEGSSISSSEASWTSWLHCRVGAGEVLSSEGKTKQKWLE
ncbi:hypothetical protein CRG98_002157 [Punica granatum]|uniref:Uncharacterized protein n=1 Tax=Punica granatum TaxID=22663 RepID=A0A2I0LA41_PUNGR|nr:hypothetical protein CRG98_002157 [Punica granatum]